jgi:tetratricopeptide (TPR) repeat protein
MREQRRLPWRSLLAVAAVLALLVAVDLYFVHEGLHRRVDYAFLRARTVLQRVRPHDRYLPTPDLSALPVPDASPIAAGQVEQTPIPTASMQPTPTVAVALTPARSPSVEAVAAVTPTPTAASRTTDDPTPTTTPTAVQAPDLGTQPPPAPVVLETDCYEPQGWNNCGPATLSMALCFYGWTGDQYTVAAATKPDGDDKNVSPDEMVAYAIAQEDIFALMGYATDVELLKRLIAAGYPTIVETWFIPEPDDQMGHYRLLTGYDDTTQRFVAQDAYHGADQRIGYDELERLWKVFDRVYVVVSPADRTGQLRALLGQQGAPERMYGDALALALAEIEANPEDRYAWFNAGTNSLGLGQVERAAAAYDQARLLKLPWRMLWYQFGPFEAYLRAGRYQEVIALAGANLRTSNNLEESYYYRALARRALGDEEGARQDLETALRYNPLYERAAEALND